MRSLGCCLKRGERNSRKRGAWVKIPGKSGLETRKSDSPAAGVFISVRKSSLWRRKLQRTQQGQAWTVTFILGCKKDSVGEVEVTVNHLITRRTDEKVLRADRNPFTRESHALAYGLSTPKDLLQLIPSSLSPFLPPIGYYIHVCICVQVHNLCWKPEEGAECPLLYSALFPWGRVSLCLSLSLNLELFQLDWLVLESLDPSVFTPSVPHGCHAQLSGWTLGSEITAWGLCRKCSYPLSPCYLLSFE